MNCKKVEMNSRTLVLHSCMMRQNAERTSAFKLSAKAALIKCLDRCNNLTTMSWGLSREKIFRMIKETEKYYPRLLDVVKATPEYNNAAFLLKYHMESMLDIYKRLL